MSKPELCVAINLNNLPVQNGLLKEVVKLTVDDIAIISELTRNQGIYDAVVISFYLNIARQIGMITLFKRMNEKPFDRKELYNLIGCKVLCEDKQIRTVTSILTSKGSGDIRYFMFEGEADLVGYSSHGKPYHTGYRILMVDTEVNQPTVQSEQVEEDDVDLPDTESEAPTLTTFD